MKIIESYLTGLKSSLRASKMTLIIYLFTLLLALLVVLPFQNVLKTNLGNSMSTYTLLSDFDYTAYKDFLIQHGDVIKYFQKQFLWFGLFYLLSSIFFAGGILSVFRREKTEITLVTFFSGCAEYFSRFLRLGIIVVLIQILLAVIVYSSVGFIIESQSETIKSEATIFYIAAAGFTLHLLIAIMLLIISDYAKIIMVQNDSKKSLRSFGKAIKFTFKHFLGAYSLYLLLLVLPISLIIIYFVFDSIIGMVSPTTIIVTLIIQQIFISARIFIKVWVLASQYSYHYNYFIPDIEEVGKVLIAESEEWNLDDLNEPDTI